VRGSRTSFVAIGLALLSPVAASAQSEGVIVDPESPSAKQYALPLESARRQADPGGDGQVVPPGARATGTGAAPLFGDGIASASRAEKRSSSGSAAGTSNSTRGTAGESNGSSASGSGSSGSSGSSSAVRAAVSNPGAPSDDIGSTLLIAGGASVLLAIGGLTGFLLRRRSDH
jgi:hypothetical protein